jgi:hypothetical protein
MSNIKTPENIQAQIMFYEGVTSQNIVHMKLQFVIWDF